MGSVANTCPRVGKVTPRIAGRYGLDKGFLKIRHVLVEFLWKEALPPTPHTSESGVEGYPVVTEVYSGHYTAQIVFHNLPFPLAVYRTNTDRKLTLASGDKHTPSFGQNRDRESGLTPARWSGVARPLPLTSGCDAPLR